MNNIYERLKHLLGPEVLSDRHWKEFLDDVGTYTEAIEKETHSFTASNADLLNIIDLIPVAFFVKDSEGRFFLMNRACQELWGISFVQLRGTDGSQFFPPAQMEHFRSTDVASFKDRQPVDFEEAFWDVGTKTNRIGHTFKRPMYDVDGEPQYLVCVTIDITKQRSTQVALADREQRLITLATTDSLTKLPNHRQFIARLTEEFARVVRFNSQRSSVMMIDVDRFKQVNDTYGHITGDAVLRHFSQLLRQSLRETDTAGRVGGEEFAVILPGTSLIAARTIAERLRETVATTPLVQDGTTISLTVSIGIATMEPTDAKAEGVLARSDGALYRAKRNGRNRVELAETA